MTFPKQKQSPPGKEHKMIPEPEVIRDNYKGSEKLNNKVALITGGDSGIGRSVAVHFAREGADCVIVYLSEDKDANDTKELIEKEGRKCLLIKGDISDDSFCKSCIAQTIQEFGKLDILVNNAAEQSPKESLESITSKQIEDTFRTNIFSFFYLTKYALPHLKEGASIINTTSVTAYRGSEHLLDYSSTKGAIVSFTRSLSQNLAAKGIRVNAVAPGPIWTPLIVSTFDSQKSQKFGEDVPMGRAGQPSEVSPCFVFLASEDASYMSGQVLHPNGGEMVES